MKSIEIFIIGKYEYKYKLGTWVYYLSYKRAVIKRTGQITNAGSPNRVTLYALYQALEKVKEPCEIVVHSKIPLGFNKPKESVNKDLLVQIQTAINKAGHIVKFDTKDDFGRVDIWEQVYGTPINQDKKQRAQAKPDINNKTTPNSVFETPREPNYTDAEIEEQKAKSTDWREMYSDLMGPSQGTWVPGSGGY